MPPGDVLVEGGEQVEECPADDHVVINRNQTRYEEHTPSYTCREKKYQNLFRDLLTSLDKWFLDRKFDNLRVCSGEKWQPMCPFKSSTSTHVGVSTRLLILSFSD